MIFFFTKCPKNILASPIEWRVVKLLSQSIITNQYDELDLFQGAPVILRDGNGAIYPLAKNCLEGIRDPIWFELPPAKCLGLGFQTLPMVGPNCKNKIAVIAIGLEVSILLFFIQSKPGCTSDPARW